MTAPTYPLSLPDSPGFVQSSFALRRAVAVAQSPFTGQTQSYEHPMALWVAQVQLPPMKRATAAAWQAFLLKLHGRRGTFLLGDPDAKVPRGAISLSATPTLNAAANAGDYQVQIAGVGTSIVAFRAGDYIQLGASSTARLYMIVDDATSDGSGVVTVTIEPSIRVTVASGGAVVYQSAKTVFRLDANDIGWDADQVSRFGISFSCTEAI
jgi:hypothetical protein